ncbi:alpha beta hydrolase fold domain-containing protein [Cyclospora cayetanensis]|uniref:Alpha beta hydrolase fold domain-containing protein n=1 Tax=Cyclospora cayetanensis TaxID=88456 RepID=A0A1D3CSS4_9EIME|nr:alpha beta hydrolase fold domain-containing protein [Cyclospora cayetanensis]
MAQHSLLRTAVPDHSARRLFCPAIFTYTRLTRWPHSYRQLARDRRVMERGICKMNQMLEGMGALQHQRAVVVYTKDGVMVHVYETPRGAPKSSEQKYTFTDAWRLRLLLLKQINSIVRAATDSKAEETETEPAVPASDPDSPDGVSHGAALSNGAPPLSVAFPEKVKESRYILFLHGGAFISQNPDFYRIFLNDLSRQTGARVVAPRYRLAPECPWPGQLQDALSFYRYLIEEEGIDPSSIVVAGDSAGGNLAVTLIMQLIQHNRTVGEGGIPIGLPRALVLLSPWLDLTQSGPSYTLNRTAEPLLPLFSIEKAAALYRFGGGAFSMDLQSNTLDKTPFRNPWVSPVFLSDRTVLRSFPPTCIHTGSVEVLLSDSLLFARRLNAACRDAEVFDSPEPLLPLQIPEDCDTVGEGDIVTETARRASRVSSLPSDFGSFASPELLRSATTPNFVGNEPQAGPPLPSYFSDLGWLSEEAQNTLEKNGTVNATKTGDTEPNAVVIVWKDEFHVFPCFGFLEEPSASECTRRIAEWINKQFGESPEA